MEPEVQNPQKPEPTTPEPPKTAQPTEGTQPGDVRDGAEDKAYAGLQRKYQALFDTHTDLQVQSQQNVDKIAKLELMVESLQTEKAKAADIVADLQKGLQQKDQEFAGAERKLAKWDIVKAEYPHLARVADLVPLGEPDDMRSAFKTLDEAIKERSEAQAKALVAGTVPRAGGGRQEPPTLTDEQIWENIEKLAGTPEGNKWNDLWAERVVARESSESS